MKKLLAMVLALVMTLSLAVSANAFKDDKSISDDYAESVAVLNGMGVFKGYEDGSFKPEGNITRAEVATIFFRLLTDDVRDENLTKTNRYSDVAATSWLVPVGLRATSATAPTPPSSRAIPMAPSSRPARSPAMKSSP